ncbi:DUF3348 domain-containing protein [Burkholderia plantarii]|uniref:DUF3348 domain-containing protein n=1 Tax=Burkholderia plantarii TaxID=41899 RepID=UPI0018DE430F|nr:DUF3348 domain-containing protein [Burkholderia plantarii]MBI0329300.1 DUF3348 domain-containing protein [Burkholderia plantarii]
MPPSPPRTLSGAPALVRLLASLGDTGLPPPAQAAQQPLADRLSQWLSWTDAVTLSSVLGAPAPAPAGGARARDDEAAQRCRKLRATLAAAIAADPVLAPAQAARRGVAGFGARHAPHRPAPDTPATDADFAVYRQSYLALQQLMDSDIGDLRTFLRGRLAASSPAMARLAVLDAAMERSLAARERSLFGAVPGRLAARFERLRREALANQADQTDQADPVPPAPAAGQSSADDADHGGPAASAGAPAPLAWLDTFRKDLQSVLLAELEVRFQPVEGLLAALHAR